MEKSIFGKGEKDEKKTPMSSEHEEALKKHFVIAIKEDKMSKGGSWGAQELGMLKPDQRGIISFQPMPEHVYIWQLCATDTITVILTTDGTLYSWGGITPCLGRQLDTSADAYKPMKITEITIPVVQISAGKEHVVVLDAENTVYAWGNNTYGQLAETTKALEYTALPRVIKAFNGKSVMHIFSGDYNACAVTKINAIYMWGLNTYRRLINSTNLVLTAPEPVNSLLTEEKASNEKKGEYDIPELIDCEKFFFDKSKYEVSPDILLLERRVFDVRKSAALLSKKLKDDLAKEKNDDSGAKENSEEIRNAQELIYYTSASLEFLEKKIDAIVSKENQLKKEYQALQGEGKAIETGLAALNEKEKSVVGEENELIRNQINIKEAQKSENERLLRTKTGELEFQKKRREKYEARRESYTKFQTNVKKVVKQSIFGTQPSDLELLLDNLQGHYGKIKETSLLHLKSKSKPGTKLERIIQDSDDALDKLKEEPTELKFELSDPRTEPFQKIWEMIIHNIDLRKQLNSHVILLDGQTAKKIEELETKEKIEYLPIASLKTITNAELSAQLGNMSQLLEVDYVNDESKYSWGLSESKSSTKATITPQEETKKQ